VSIGKALPMLLLACGLLSAQSSPPVRDKGHEIVNGCTDTDVTPKPAWEKRKEAYIARIPSESRATLLVSAADKLENARAILADHWRAGDTVFKRFNGKKKGTLWYYREIVKAYRKAGAPSALVDELDRVVSEIHHRANVKQP
jgi:hypothetical protein